MKPGDLVKVKGCSTGDPKWVVELYREKIPVLVLAMNRDALAAQDMNDADQQKWWESHSQWVQVHYKGGEPKYLKSIQCEVVSEAG